MKTAKLTSSLLPLLSVGMYASNLSPDDVLVSDSKVSDKAIEQFWNNFDNSKYVKQVLKASKLIFKTIITPELLRLDLGITKVKVVEIHSPKYYNYGTDELYFDVTFKNLNIVLNIIEQSREKLDLYLKENNKSYDGFVSFMPQSTYELIKAVTGEDFDRGIGAFLTWYLRDLFYFEFNEIQDELIKECNKISPLDCVSDLRKVKTFKTEYYQNC